MLRKKVKKEEGVVNEQAGGCQPLNNFKCKCKLKYWPRYLLSSPGWKRATTACLLLRYICILSGHDPITPPLHRVSCTLAASLRRLPTPAIRLADMDLCVAFNGNAKIRIWRCIKLQRLASRDKYPDEGHDLYDCRETIFAVYIQTGSRTVFISYTTCSAIDSRQK